MPPLQIENLPPELQEALRRFQRRWRMVNTMSVIGLLLSIPLTSFILLAVSDRLWATPDWVRFLLAVPVPLLVAAALAPYVRRWVLHRPGPRQLAEVMGRLDRRVGDRLLGAVELSEGRDREGMESPALRKAAIEQVTRELANVRAEERIDVSMTRKVGIAALALVLAGGTYAVLAPDAARNSFTRWLRPHRPIERFTFVRFSDFPAELHVAHGEGFSFGGRVSHVRGEAVREVEARLSGPERVRPRVEEGRVTVEAEGMTQPREVRLRAGDGQARVAVSPQLRPELVSMGARIEWPAYLGLEAEESTLRRRRLEVPYGSTVRLEGRVSRELEKALAEELGEARVLGEVFELPPLEIDEDKTLTLKWVDRLGLSPRNPAMFEFIAQPDQPPRVTLSGLPHAVAMLEDEFVTFEIGARDDYGLERVWTRWTVRRGGEEEGGVRRRDAEIEGRSGREEVSFSPERFGYGPGDRIEVVAKAVDAYPDREPSVSSRHRILVLSKEEHAEMVLQQMDGVLDQLDEVIRRESLALEENRALHERSDEDLAHESTAEEMVGRALDELGRREQLMETRGRMEHLIGEATKNEQIGDEQIADWTRIVEELKEGADPAMQAAAEAMREGAEASGVVGEEGATGEGESAEAGMEETSERREWLEEAMRWQEEAIAAMQQGERELNESIEQSLSESFYNRLMALSGAQQRVGDRMREDVPEDAYGMEAENLPEEVRGVLRDLGGEQEGIFRESRYVYDDLNGFRRRMLRNLAQRAGAGPGEMEVPPQVAVLDQISTEMEAERFDDRLSGLREKILENVIGRATVESEEWSRLFAEWAALLGDEDGESPGEGGDAGDEEGEDLETMIALLRAREGQERLRRHTRELDESYEENLNYGKDAVKLSDRQYELGMSLQPLENRVRTEGVKQLISLASGEMMNAGVNLRRPQTDSETIAIQTEVIELLAAALEQSMGGGEGDPSEGDPSEQQQQNAQMMQALLGMMEGMGQGDTGGEGATGFGDPGEADISGAGLRNFGEEARERGGAGMDPSRWPASYRGMMDAYYRAMEE